MTYPPACLSEYPLFGWETSNWHCGDWNMKVEDNSRHSFLSFSRAFNKMKYHSYVPFYSSFKGYELFKHAFKPSPAIAGGALTSNMWKLRYSIQLVPILGNLILFIIDLFATIVGHISAVIKKENSKKES